MYSIPLPLLVPSPILSFSLDGDNRKAEDVDNQGEIKEGSKELKVYARNDRKPRT